MNGPMRFVRNLLLALCFAWIAAPASAQDRETPYWASLRASEVNMRVGPSEEYAIDWVYHRAHLPVKVVRIKEGWRLVRDPDGAEGWIVARLLSPDRSVLVIGQGLAPMRDVPSQEGQVLWQLEPGVVGILEDCESAWCQLDVDGHKGWVSQMRLWGAGDP
jgi:SH3-like domain-containing protein